MVSKGPLLRLLTAINRRRMKLLVGLACIAYVASVWGNFVNMRSLQENGDQKVESKIEEAVAPLREKIKDLEKRCGMTLFLVRGVLDTHSVRSFVLPFYPEIPTGEIFIRKGP
uniref:UDP-glucuronate decarboxylase 1 n=1 Tax=Gallus gallus TaxID=9031 RepID=A0A8V0YJT1_CHICK